MMTLRHFLKICFLLLFIFCLLAWGRYEPTWASLDTRPLPQWFDDAKVGIFIHWGVFSVPSFGNEWFWFDWKSMPKVATVKFMLENYRPGWTYPDFAPQFTAEFFNASQWADLFNASGARYIVLTSKHHEGFTMWPSSVSWNWNAMDVGPNRDIVGELADAVRARAPDVHFGLYHSLYEWFNPLFESDKVSGYTKQDFVKGKTMPELLEIVRRYKPEVIWSDGDWTSTPSYWNSTNFLAWLYNDSPVKDTVVVNDRWGIGTTCKHGDFWNCGDKTISMNLTHKWEYCTTIDSTSWGYVRNSVLSNYKTIEEIISQLVVTVAFGGNMLINVGPSHDGRILPIFEERLRQMGSWLKVNGEAIYETRKWKVSNDSSTLYYTSGKEHVHALFLDWPNDDTLSLPSIPADSPGLIVEFVGLSGPEATLKWTPSYTGSGIDVILPLLNPVKLPCNWAWGLRLKGVAGKENYIKLGNL